MFKANNKTSRTTSLTSDFFIVNFEHIYDIFKHFYSVAW